jgi:hypothetical protein
MISAGPRAGAVGESEVKTEIIKCQEMKYCHQRNPSEISVSMIGMAIAERKMARGINAANMKYQRKHLNKVSNEIMLIAAKWRNSDIISAKLREEQQ